MFLPCPHCGYAVALILPSQATGPRGPPQRCPRCEGALRVEPAAVSPVQGDPTAEANASEPMASGEADSANAEPSNAPDVGASQPDRSAAAADAPAATPGARDAKPSDPRAGRTRRLPSFIRGSPPATTADLAWPWVAAIVALGLLLVLQLLLAQRHELAASARWRPWVASLCNALPCEIPAWHEPRAFTMLDRSVQPSRTMAGVLSVEASFRNDARWPQPWPTLLLGLSDVEGHQVGSRAFAPAEYREGAVGADDPLAPGQSATVRLQVREPAPRIVAFTFDFQ